MSFWDSLNAAATPLATAAAANQQGIQQGQEQNTNSLLDTVKLYQQKAAQQLATQKAQSEMGLQSAQADEAKARASTLLSPPQKPHTKTWDAVNRVFVDPETSDVTTPVNQPPAPDKTPIMGTPDWIAAERAKAKIASEFRPPEPSQLVDVPDPQHPGQTVKAWADPRSHQITVTQQAALPKGQGAGAQNAPQMAAAKANMESALATMDAFEAKLKAGKASYGPLDASKGAISSSPAALTATGPLGFVNSLSSNVAGQSLRQGNPDLQNYLTAKKYVAEAILNTHKRPNQTQYEIEQELSSAGPGVDARTPAGAAQLDMAKARRDRMYSEVFANPSVGAPSAPAAPSRVPSFEEWQAAQKKPE